MPSGVSTYCPREHARQSGLACFRPFRAGTHVVVLPREVGGQVAARGERLARLDDEEVLDIEVLVLDLEVLLRNENAVCEGWSASVLALAGRDGPIPARNSGWEGGGIHP